MHHDGGTMVLEQPADSRRIREIVVRTRNAGDLSRPITFTKHIQRVPAEEALRSRNDNLARYALGHGCLVR
jgi:hypothetical protein